MRDSAERPTSVSASPLPMTSPRCTSTLTPNSNPNLLPLPLLSTSPFPPLTTRTSPPLPLPLQGLREEVEAATEEPDVAVRVSATKKSYEERELSKSYWERKEEIRRNEEEKRKRTEEMKKEENILRSGTKLQRISNSNTLKKLAKSKQRKLLKIVPDEVLNKGKGKK